MLLSDLSRNARRLVRALISARGGLDRAALASELSLSRPTIKTLVDDLKKAGIVEELPAAAGPSGLVDHASGPDSARGRPPGLLRLTRSLGAVAVFDLGHRHLQVGLLDANSDLLDVRLRLVSELEIESDELGDDAREIGRDRVDAVDVDEAGPVVLYKAASLLSKCLDKSGLEYDDLRAVVVGIPAPLTHEGVVAAPSFLKKWAHVPIDAAVAQALQQEFRLAETRIPIHIEKDANLCALGEVAARRSGVPKDVVFVRCSAGIGMGLYLNSQLHTGSNGFAGELGHLSVPSTWNRGTPLTTRTEGTLPVRPPCPRCGRMDCLENLASGEAIVATLTAAAGEELTLERVLALAKMDEPGAIQGTARQAIVEAGLKIGAVLGQAATLLDPDLIVVGGRLASAGEVLRASIQDGFDTHVLFTDVTIELVHQQRAPRVALDGGAMRAWRHFSEQLLRDDKSAGGGAAVA